VDLTDDLDVVTTSNLEYFTAIPPSRHDSHPLRPSIRKMILYTVQSVVYIINTDSLRTYGDEKPEHISKGKRWGSPNIFNIYYIL